MDLVTAFNDCINARDLAGLSALMSEEHVFTDSAGAAVSGKQQCLAAWTSFFAAFPDYRNIFESMSGRGEEIIVTGRSECSDTRLIGPALWSARVAGGRIAAWRVFADTPGNREHLGIAKQSDKSV